VEATYFDEKVVMWGRHDVVSELEKKNRKEWRGSEHEKKRVMDGKAK
jgi:hypothetical protein